MNAPLPLRVALVGAGAMGSLHARVLTHSQDTELRYVVDPAARAGTLLAERYRSQWVADLEDFDGVDAVVVASPTATHREWTLRAISAGKPVLVEKPIADRLDDTRAVIAAARHAGVPLMCGLLERFNPAVRTALEIVDEPMHVVTARHSPYVDRIVTGVGHDLLLHDVDIVLRLTGRLPNTIEAAYAYCHPKSTDGAEDIADVTLRYDGLLAFLSASRVSQRKVRTLVIAELERLIEVDLVRQDLTVYRHIADDAFEEDSSGYRQQTIIDIPALRHPGEPLATQLDRFVAIARGHADAVADLDSLLAPHLIVAATEQASRANRADSPARFVGNA